VSALPSSALPSNIHATLAATKWVCSSLTEDCALIRRSLPNLTAIFENYVAEIRLDGKAVHLGLWDTAYVIFCLLYFDAEMHFRGQEEYEVGTHYILSVAFRME
jgi:hypothetical protein